MFVDVSHEISTKVKRWAITLTVETVDFLAHIGYKGELSCIFVNEMSNMKVHIFNKY